MNSVSIIEAGSLLRGLTYQGTHGLFVRYFDGVFTGDPSQTIEFTKDIEEFILLFKKYFDLNQCYPSAVLLDEGWFAFGNSYDTVGNDKQCCFSEKLKKRSRNDVVRGKIALVTGGAQGLGESIVRSLTEAGAFVYIADIQIKKSESLSKELNHQYQQTVVLPVQVDVSNEESVVSMMEMVARNTGGLDLFISNAGVLQAGSVKEMKLKDFDFVTQVDYTGYFLCAKHAARMLSLQNKPTGKYFTDIIVVSSKSGLEGSNKNSAYAGAKFGTIGLTQSFALELVADNIKVNALCPGNFFDGPLWSDPKYGLFVQYFQTGKVPGAKSANDVRKYYENKVPMLRGCRSEDIMKAVFYIVEQEYETGQAVPVTGGQVMLN